MYQSSKLIIYFGDSQDSISVEEIDLQQKGLSILSVQKKINADQVAFLQQTHSIEGLYLDSSDDENYLFNRTGDYIFTQKRGSGVGILTADCLPIVIYDSKHHVVSIVHAGWKGLVAGVFQAALQAMRKKWGVRLKNLEIYLGPAAKSCCYEVQQDFIDRFIDYKADFSSFFIEKNDKTYFDSRFFIMVVARNLGIDKEKIYTRYNVCTMCNLSFCSYRREKNKARRQISMACLR